MIYIRGLHEIDIPYKGLVVDLWGVMHNGKALFPQAIEALRSAKAEGKSVTLLSNAPRRRDAALEKLTDLGLSTDLFDDLITSGEITWQAIHTGKTEHWGPRAYLLGAGADRDIKRGLGGLEFVEDLDQAQWILNVGPPSGHEDTGPFEDLIGRALDRKLPMICANPDLIVQRGANLEICAGAIAKTYEERGGNLIWLGKPHGEVYQAVFKSSGLKAADLLAVGDSFKTDVRGANQQGMPVMYVNSGIHGCTIGRPLDLWRVRDLATAHQAIPTYVAEAFAP